MFIVDMNCCKNTDLNFYTFRAILNVSLNNEINWLLINQVQRWLNNFAIYKYFFYLNGILYSKLILRNLT